MAILQTHPPPSQPSTAKHLQADPQYATPHDRHSLTRMTINTHGNECKKEEG